MNITIEKLQALLTPFDQSHLLRYWDQLSSKEQNNLAGEISNVDFAQLELLFSVRDDGDNLRNLIAEAGPPPVFRLDGRDNRFSAAEANSRAEEALAEGSVGVILVAGGQGTRLGFPHPKGMFPIGPVSGNSLFQIHIEKILADSHRYGVAIPLYLMTSPATHDETAKFLARNERFGLPENQLMIFCQGTMPAVDAQSGKVLLESKSHLALSPDGHGGMLAALIKSGALADAQRRGISHLFYFQVDNPLVDICGREFLGYHLLSESEFSSQVIAKRDPLERVGNIMQGPDGRLFLVEYSDLPDDVARQRAADGSLKIWAGSIAVHVMATDFLNRMAAESAANYTVNKSVADRNLANHDVLPFHTARKKVPYVGPSGEIVQPDSPNALKFERFIFDLMPEAQRAIAVEVDRESAFAPLKNASDQKTDTPETVKRQISAVARSWLRQAGAEVADDVVVEISPLFARTPQELAEKIETGMRVTENRYFR